MDFPRRLKEEREKRDLTQIELAKAIGISNVMLSRYEKGTRSPDFETLVALADFFGCTIDYLLGHNQLAETKAGYHVEFQYPFLEQEERVDIKEYVKEIRDVISQAVAAGDIPEEDAEELLETQVRLLKFQIEELKKKQ